ncbi:hypothetical protein SODALDRAFT_53203 [Sodiomyces alkalinus F11]|uniref:Uncharacterized protein n=1 Tax=Sodiomyces alkalinus (strain CBS 110278 / VKM F-3762 / F11) TaxID=1314773 RepID=A0A3N2PN22_SODAK|nr:hypothetical protein SODALDRAFT_53203 [Sodiomyces alkalinus F11]ROT35879.1 hypothetical protein SODALDRAFT_53203 [Sodiomyces alkalinus F11]
MPPRSLMLYCAWVLTPPLASHVNPESALTKLEEGETIGLRDISKQEREVLGDYRPPCLEAMGLELAILSSEA